MESENSTSQSAVVDTLAAARKQAGQLLTTNVRRKDIGLVRPWQ